MGHQKTGKKYSLPSRTLIFWFLISLPIGCVVGVGLTLSIALTSGLADITLMKAFMIILGALILLLTYGYAKLIDDLSKEIKDTKKIRTYKLLWILTALSSLLYTGILFNQVMLF